VIAVNFKGAYFTIQKALPLLTQGSSVIIMRRWRAQGVADNLDRLDLQGRGRHLARISAPNSVDRGIRVNTLSRGRRTPRCSVASQAKSGARR